MKIENASYILEVSPENGALVRLRDKVGGVELLTHARLAESFRLLVPLPELEANYILGTEQHLFPSRLHDRPHISTRQYARIVHRWVERAGLDSSAYGTHSMRRTKAAQIYKTGNLRAVQLLLGHTKLESTVRYLGIEVDDALSVSEQVEL